MPGRISNRRILSLLFRGRSLAGVYRLGWGKGFKRQSARVFVSSMTRWVCVHLLSLRGRLGEVSGYVDIWNSRDKARGPGDLNWVRWVEHSVCGIWPGMMVLFCCWSVLDFWNLNYCVLVINLCRKKIQFFSFILINDSTHSELVWYCIYISRLHLLGHRAQIAT